MDEWMMESSSLFWKAGTWLSNVKYNSEGLNLISESLGAIDVRCCTTIKEAVHGPGTTLSLVSEERGWLQKHRAFVEGGGPPMKKPQQGPKRER